MKKKQKWKTKIEKAKEEKEIVIFLTTSYYWVLMYGFRGLFI